MKRLSIFFVVVFLLTLSYTEVFAQARFAYSSGVITASKQVVVGPILLTDLAVYTNGADTTVVLYDSKSGATGVVIGQITVLAAAKAGGLIIPIPVKATYGVYLLLSGSGGTAIVFTTPQ